MFFFLVFFAGLFLKPQDYLTLDLSHLSLAGQQRQHVWNVVETDTTPPRSLIPRSCDGSPLNCLWFVFFTTPLVFSKEWGWNFSKNSSECLMIYMKDVWNDDAKKQTQGELMLHEIFDLPQFFWWYGKPDPQSCLEGPYSSWFQVNTASMADFPVLCFIVRSLRHKFHWFFLRGTVTFEKQV